MGAKESDSATASAEPCPPTSSMEALAKHTSTLSSLKVAVPTHTLVGGHGEVRCPPTRSTESTPSAQGASNLRHATLLANVQPCPSHLISLSPSASSHLASRCSIHGACGEPGRRKKDELRSNFASLYFPDRRMRCEVMQTTTSLH